MLVINAFVTVPLYTLCALAMHHKTEEGILHKEFRKMSQTMHHTLEVALLYLLHMRVRVYCVLVMSHAMGQFLPCR